METAGLATLRLVRRVGLALGVFVVCENLPEPYGRLGFAIGASIVAFFLPRIEPTSFQAKEKQPTL